MARGGRNAGTGLDPMTAHRDRVTTLAATTLDLGQKVDTVLRVQEQMRRVQEQHGDAIASLTGDVTDLRGTVGRIEEMLVKLLDGQAVLHQNDMELKRRLDAMR